MFLPRRIGRAAPRPGASKVVASSAIPPAAAPLDPIVPCAGLVIRAWAPVAEGEESSSGARTRLVSALESLAPRTVAYVDMEAVQDEEMDEARKGRWVRIRSRSPKHAKALLRALQPNSVTRDIPHALAAAATTAAPEPTPMPVEDAAMLSGSDEAAYWSKIPERVRNAATKRAALESEQTVQARREKRRRKVERRRARRRASRAAKE